MNKTVDLVNKFNFSNPSSLRNSPRGELFSILENQAEAENLRISNHTSIQTYNSKKPTHDASIESGKKVKKI